MGRLRRLERVQEIIYIQGTKDNSKVIGKPNDRKENFVFMYRFDNMPITTGISALVTRHHNAPNIKIITGKRTMLLF